MLIKYRIYLSLLLLSLLPLLLVSLLTERMLEGELRRNIVSEFQNLAREKAESIGRHFDERINETRLLANHPTIIAAAKEANGRYQGRDEHAVIDEIHRLDKAWIANKGATERAEQIGASNVSLFLKTIQARNPESYGEIFLTDKLGANVAMTRALSDYYQADEYWWQAGYQHVQEGAFFDDRGFDASVGAIVIGVVVPVIDDGEVIGVFKINFMVRSALDIVSAKGLEPGHVLLLVRSDGSVIFCSDETHLEKPNEVEIRHTETEDDMHLSGSKDIGQLSEALNDKGMLSAHHPMKHTFMTRQAKGAVKGITGETTQVKTWYVLYGVDKTIAFASINKLGKTALSLAIGALFLVALIGLLLSRAITRPLLALKSGTELIGDGNLAYRINLRGGGEFVALANSFNDMAQKLQESEGQFKTLVTNTEEIIYMISLDGTFLLSEGRGLAALGLAPGTVVGMSIFELYKDYPDMLDEMRRAFNGETVIAEAKVGDIYFSNSYTPHKNSEGEIIGLLGLSVNITQQKHAEEAILDSKQRLKELTESVPVGIAVSTPEGQITEVNKIAVEMFGYDSKESFMSDAAADRYNDPQDREHFIKLLKKGPVKNFETHLKRCDGSLFWCSTSSVMHTDKNGTVQIISAFTDITERQKMEDKLRKLAQAVEQSSESIVITNLDAEIEYVNDAFLRTTGYSREEAIGQNLNVLQSGRTPGETYEAMWDSLKHGFPWKGEFHNQRKDGTEFIEFAMVTPLRQPDGSITHYVAVKEDITEKKQLAVELDNHRHHLEELVEERTVQLATASERAEAANQAKSLFLANMSHEIRTPLNAIIGLTHLMQRAGATPAQAKQLTKIDTAGTHLLSVINDILDISKIESERLVLEHTDFHLDTIFDNIQSLLKEQANSKGVIIETNLDDVPQWLRGDPTRLRQALLNYVSNAVKFTEKGTISLRAKKLEERDDEILVQFEVQDSGIGIKPDRLSRLFEAFEQADTSTTREYGGTGLGLVITSRLAQLMGGNVGAESEPGQGSTFWFTVWLGRGHGVMPDRAVTEVVDTPMVLRNQYAGSRILLVEDNAINQEVAVELLCSVGMAVDTAKNGREAVEMARTGSYDLILMDIQMPEMDGLEATRLIRKKNDKEQLPILAMSANVFEEYRQASLVAGMNDFVAKPVDPKNLFATIIKWLPKHEFSTEVTPPPERSIQQSVEEAALREQLVAIESIDAETGLRNMRGDVAGYLRLLHQFDTTHGEDMSNLIELLTDGEGEEARRSAHTIKGAAGTLGLLRLQEAAKALEMYLRNPNDDGDDDETTRLMEIVSTEQKSLHEALAHIDAKSEPVSTVEADPVEAQAVLDRLAPLLAISDAAVSNLFLESEELLKQCFGPAAAQLGQQIESFDYPAALITLESISEKQGHL